MNSRKHYAPPGNLYLSCCDDPVQLGGVVMWVGRISAAGCVVAARQQASGRAGQGAGHALSCRSHSIYIQPPLFPIPRDPRPPSVPHLFFAFAPRTPCALCRPMPIYRPMHMPMYSRMMPRAVWWPARRGCVRCVCCANKKRDNNNNTKKNRRQEVRLMSRSMSYPYSPHTRYLG